tara:strand:+ start:149 stop:343 length:195 start_codon:yes stop_codon:yes gene_type:complete
LVLKEDAMTDEKTADRENDRLALESFGTQDGSVTIQGLILREMFDTLLETQRRIKELEKEKTDD